jgi:hypothetical protein
MLRATIVLSVLCVLAGCASKSSEDEAAAAKAQAQAAPPPKTFLDPQLKALQKAKDVQKTVDDSKQATDKAIDDGGG